MRVYISVDMEGIGGVSHPDPTESKDAKYPAAVSLMVEVQYQNAGGLKP